MTIPAGPSVEYPRPLKRRRDVGLIAFSLAVMLVLLLPIGMLLLNAPNLSGEGAALASTLWLIQGSGMIMAFLLGLAAVITERGGGWGVAAMVLAVLGNAYIWLLISSSLTAGT